MKDIVISDKLTLFNLHTAALKKCDIASSNSKVKGAFDDLVFNTGVDPKTKDHNSTFGNKDDLYEVAVICDLSKLKNISGKTFSYTLDISTFSNVKDLTKSVYDIDDNKDILSKVDTEAFNVIMRYMKVFVGSKNTTGITKDKVSKVFYTAKDKIEVDKYAFQPEDVKPNNKDDKKDHDTHTTNTVNFLLYKIAYTVGKKPRI